MFSKNSILKHITVLKWLVAILIIVVSSSHSNTIVRIAVATLVGLWLLSSAWRLEAECQKLRRAVSIDELTGLGNFRAFQERLRIEVERSRRTGTSLVLVLIDLDQFKSYNDNYGHRRGNEFLRVCGQLFTDSVRTADGVYRFGGDEFAIVLPGTELEEARRVVTRVRNEFAKLELREMVTLSIGIAAYQQETPDQFFDRVDSLLYDVKSRGGDCCRTETTTEVATV